MIQFGTNQVGLGGATCIIAEAAVEHCGSLNIAKRMVDVAVKANVDFVKFQYHMPEKEMLPDRIKFWGGSMDSILRNFNLSHEDHIELIDYCKSNEIQYLCTPFCPDAVRKLDEIGVVGFKTGSGELTNISMFEEIAKTGKPVIVSAGMATLAEINFTCDFLKSRSVPFALMNCTSVYPCPDDQVYLHNIEFLRNEFGVPVGHSDHTPDDISSIGAVALGASVIEKHFTMSRDIGGPDASVSLEPDELISLVKNIRRIESARQPKQKMSPAELETKSWANHSIVAVKHISKGATILTQDVAPMRPAGGIPASDIFRVVNSIARVDILEGTPLKLNDIKFT